MWNNGHDAYLEGRILSADPLELVHLLYQGCAQSVCDARFHLAEGRISERSHAITKACEILMELTNALNYAKGGEIAQRLGLLYDYMRSRLIEANVAQSESPLLEVLGLLDTLSGAWESIRPATPKSAPVPANGPWAASIDAPRAQSWSF